MAEPASYGPARELLIKRGFKVKKIYRLESAGDSGTGATEVLFTIEGDKPRTGYITVDVDWEKEDVREVLEVRVGW